MYIYTTVIIQMRDYHKNARENDTSLFSRVNANVLS